MLKLNAFRIRNFRSIVDTGWQNLSPDNITCLIGQNESGKTSVLEGLKAFYTGAISEDVLRSDLSLPEIQCRFNIEKGWLLKITDNPGTEMRELLSGLDHLELTRSWLADFSSIVKVSGEISQYLDSLENAWRLYLDEVKSKLEDEINKIEVLEENARRIALKKADTEQKINLEEKSESGFWIFRKKDTSEAKHSGNSDLKKELRELTRQEEELTRELLKKRLVKKTGGTYNTVRSVLEALDEKLSTLSVKLEERHQKMTLLMEPMEDSDDSEWNKVIEEYRRTKSERDRTSEDLSSRHSIQWRYYGWKIGGRSPASPQ